MPSRSALTMPCLTALASTLLLLSGRSTAAPQEQTIGTERACAAGAGAPGSPPQGGPTQLMDPGATHDFTIGNASAKIILDLVPPCLPVFALVNSDVEVVKRALCDPDYPMDPSLPLVHINVLYVDTGSERILFDAGAGAAAGGALARRLREDGIAPESITRVLLTHAHWDHIDGLFAGDGFAFPNAAVHVSRTEWEYFRAATVDRLTARVSPWVFDALADGAKRSLTRIEERVELFELGEQVLPGVHSVASTWHTPGHSSFVLSAGDEQLLVTGDAVMSVPLGVHNPWFEPLADHSPEKGVRGRFELLERAARGGMLVSTFHIPHPGLGRIEADGGMRFRWRPAA